MLNTDVFVGASLVGKDSGDELASPESTAESSQQLTLLLPAFSDHSAHILPPSLPQNFAHPHLESSGQKAGQCVTCGERFSDCRLYALHRCLHRQDSPHVKCSVCKQRFSRSADLQLHVCPQSNVRFEHQNDIRNQQSSNQHRLSKHKHEWSPGPLYSCSTCHKHFRSNSHLTRHQQVHTGVRPYQCSVCEKRFSEPSSVKRHMYIHTNEAPHACPTCGHRYSSPCYLREHMLSHTGERPNKCPVCEKQYSRAGHLTRHLRQHAGCKEPIVCDLSRSELGGSVADSGGVSE